jgi:hypothetical protein
LTEIYLCNVCPCQEILRRDGRGQAHSLLGGALALFHRGTLVQPLLGCGGACLLLGLTAGLRPHGGGETLMSACAWLAEIYLPFP